MTFAATFLGGAKSRLLPWSITFRFFGAAAVFHVLLWLFLLFNIDNAINFAGGFGPTLVTIHLLTLGVLVTAAIGAAAQILPVITRRTPTETWRVRLVFWLTIPGILFFATGIYLTTTPLLIVGVCAIGTGLFLFAWLMVDHLRLLANLPLVAAYGWVALASLVGVTGLGIGLVFNYSFDFSQNTESVALAHMILGGFGFMGFLVLSFSNILIPMFALSSAPARWPTLATLVISTLALFLGTFGALAGSRSMLTAAAGTGLVAAGGHLWLMYRVLAKGLRKHFGLSFILVRGAWTMLPITLLAGLNALYGIAGDHRTTLFGFLLFFGWLMSFLFGILQRIQPFLASMFLPPPARGGTAIVPALSGATSLKLHAGCHTLAVLVIAAGIAIDNVAITRLGSAIGLIGAIAFAWFTTDIILRMLSNSTL